MASHSLEGERSVPPLADGLGEHNPRQRVLPVVRKAISMLELRSQPARPYRVVRRAKVQPAEDLTIRPVRPSPFTVQPLADACIVNEGDEILSLQVGERCLAVICGTPLDCQSFNRLLDRLRHKPPRPRR